MLISVNVPDIQDKTLSDIKTTNKIMTPIYTSKRGSKIEISKEEKLILIEQEKKFKERHHGIIRK